MNSTFPVSQVVFERAFVIYDVMLGYTEDFFFFSLENLTHFLEEQNIRMNLFTMDHSLVITWIKLEAEITASRIT